jgi:hypothetical protein
MCLSTLGWIALSGGTGGGAIAGLIMAVRRRKSKESDND